MYLWEIRDILNAKVLTGEERLQEQAFSACGSDFMSDVLAFAKDQGILLTGLITPAVIRTADMMGMRCVVFVRGKQPTREILSVAEERGILVMTSAERLYNACGKLYLAGLGRL